MKKRLQYLALLLLVGGALVLCPFASSDVAELVPVEVLVLSRDGEFLVVDAGEIRGRGATWTEAWQDLRQGAPGTVFLGTAEYLVLADQTADLLPDILKSELLRPGARVCLCPGKAPRADLAAPYLLTRERGTTLQQVRAAMVQGTALKLPVLLQTKGGLRLYGT